MGVDIGRGGQIPVAILSGLTLVGLGLALSCQPAVIKDEPHKTQGMRFETPAMLEPDRLPYAKASLILAGTKYPVEVLRTANKEHISFEFAKDGETIDREVYVLNGDGFQVSQCAGLSYQPPIPLVLFPMNVGDRWEWSGEVLAGSERQSATASMRSQSESLNLESGFYDGFKVEVDLKFGQPGPPLDKRMAFWFVPKQGIVKREFGSTSTRGPLSP